MNLFFADIGNTAIKIYGQDESLFFFSYQDGKDKLEHFFHSGKPDLFLVSSVSGYGLEMLSKNVKLIKIDYKFPFSFELDIENPETVGIDRLVNIEGALAKGNMANFIVIDAGSAVTIDLLCRGEKDNIFKGGVIIPGEQLQYKVLMANTCIPEFGYQREHRDILGRNTRQAVENGIRNCLLYGIKGIVNKLAENYRVSALILAGGDSLPLYDSRDFRDGLRIKNVFYEEKLAFFGFQSIAKKIKLV